MPTLESVGRLARMPIHRRLERAGQLPTWGGIAGVGPVVFAVAILSFGSCLPIMLEHVVCGRESAKVSHQREHGANLSPLLHRHRLALKLDRERADKIEANGSQQRVVEHLHVEDQQVHRRTQLGPAICERILERAALHLHLAENALLSRVIQEPALARALETAQPLSLVTQCER
eukprot:4360757-Prymnesium_polylepis.1